MRPKTRAIMFGAAVATGAAVADFDLSKYIQQQYPSESPVPPAINTKQTTLSGGASLPVSCASGNVSSCMATANQSLLVSACKEVNATAPTDSTKSQSVCVTVKSSTQVTSGYKDNFLPAAEGVHLTPYTDSLGNCTVGIGHLLDHNPCTKQQLAQHYLLSQVNSAVQKNLDQAEACVRQNMKGYNMSSCEFDALTDRSFNSGCAGAKNQGSFSSAQESLNTGNYAYINNSYDTFMKKYYAKSENNWGSSTF
jgi:GH24 family phage-related lysozyme (muramidase)